MDIYLVRVLIKTHWHYEVNTEFSKIKDVKIRELLYFFNVLKYRI